MFTLAIEAASHLLLGIAPSTLRTILIPVVVSLITGVLLHKYFPRLAGAAACRRREAAFRLP